MKKATFFSGEVLTKENFFKNHEQSMKATYKFLRSLSGEEIINLASNDIVKGVTIAELIMSSAYDEDDTKVYFDLAGKFEQDKGFSYNAFLNAVDSGKRATFPVDLNYNQKLPLSEEMTTLKKSSFQP